jgi:hypothetical protein
VPDGRLAISITHADGWVTRLGPDEVDAAMIPQGLSFSTSMPGGFRDATFQLLLRIDLETALELFDEVTVYGPGGETVWEGRITQLPRQHGAGFGISPGAVGHAAHLKDDPTFRMVYVDRDPGTWQEASLTRKRVNATATRPQGKVPVTIGEGGVTWLPPDQSLTTDERTEVLYDAGPGVEISRLEYRGTRTGAFTNFEAATVFTDSDDQMASTSSEALTLDDTINVATAFTDDRWMMLRTNVTSTVTPTAGWQQSYDLLAVYGNHGVGVTAVTGDASGILASAVLGHIISNAAPDLNYTTGADGSIETSTFAIPHLVFREPVTAEDAILFVNAYHQYEWGVYEGKTFFWRATDPDRLCWEARLADGAHLDLEGPQSADTYNGVYVTYTDALGVRKTVGPTGATADDTSAALLDSTETNPINAHGIDRKWARLDISQVTTLEGATQLGSIWLAEQAIPQRRGSVRITGTCQHPTRGERPVWAIRAGDYIRISDHPADVPRRIIQTQYDHSSRTVTCEVGSGSPQKIDAILQRLNVYSVGRY